ncbi:MAG TPA: hypothetical protein PK156_31835 [Polyangium sp.]|nr:hypothetical protein [Polyangium sp.]
MPTSTDSNSTPEATSGTPTTMGNTPTSTADAIVIAAKKFNVDANALRTSVCYHESAHAAVALHYGCTVREIQLTAVPGSLAGTEIVQGLGGKGIFVQMTAGPLCDRQRNNHYQFPESFLMEFERGEKRSFERELLRKLPKFNSAHVDALWQSYTNDARGILALPRIQAFLDALAARIMAALDAGERTVTGSEIMVLWNQHGVDGESAR